jgi:hypothetical protein
VAALPVPIPVTDTAVIRAAWKIWQDGLAERFSLPEALPPLRLLPVWDNLAGHKTPEMVGWLCQHGIMPLYTPLGGSWLNMPNQSNAVSSGAPWPDSIPTRPPKSALGSSRPHAPGTERQRPSSGMAGIGQRRRHHPGNGHLVAGSAARSPQPLPGRQPPYQQWQNSRQVTH